MTTIGPNHNIFISPARPAQNQHRQASFKGNRIQTAEEAGEAALNGGKKGLGRVLNVIDTVVHGGASRAARKAAINAQVEADSKMMEDIAKNGLPDDTPVVWG